MRPPAARDGSMTMPHTESASHSNRLMYTRVLLESTLAAGGVLYVRAAASSNQQIRYRCHINIPVRSRPCVQTRRRRWSPWNLSSYGSRPPCCTWMSPAWRKLWRSTALGEDPTPTTKMAPHQQTAVRGHHHVPVMLRRRFLIMM